MRHNEREWFNRFANHLQKARSLSSGGPDFTKPGIVMAWYEKLGHIPEDKLVQALRELAGEDFFPGATKILNHAQGKTGVSGAKSAFDWVWNNLDERNIPRDLSILAGRTVDEMGGWANCSRLWRDSQREQLGREFCRIYCDLEEKQLAGVFIGGSKLALESSESKKEGLSVTLLPEWRKQHLEDLEKDLRKKQANSPRSSLSFSERVSQLIGNRKRGNRHLVSVR